jgi:hypothetical protein
VAWPAGLDSSLLALGLTLSLGGLAVAVLSRVRGSALSVAVAGSVFAFSVGLTANHILDLYDAHISSRGFALAVAQRTGVAPISVYGLPRAAQYGCEFYLQRPLAEWTPDAPRPGWLISSPGRVRALQRQGLHLEIDSPTGTLFRVE